MFFHNPLLATCGSRAENSDITFVQVLTCVIVQGIEGGSTYTTVKAIYEQGVLRLLQPLALADGTRVAVMVITQEPPAEGRTSADMLAIIAALPTEAGGEEFA